MAAWPAHATLSAMRVPRAPPHTGLAHELPLSLAQRPERGAAPSGKTRRPAKAAAAWRRDEARPPLSRVSGCVPGRPAAVGTRYPLAAPQGAGCGRARSRSTWRARQRGRARPLPASRRVQGAGSRPRPCVTPRGHAPASAGGGTLSLLWAGVHFSAYGRR